MMPILVALIAETLRAPQAAARRLLALNIPAEARWTGLLLVVVLALLITRLMILVAPTEGANPIFGMVSDLRTGIPIQAASLLLIAVAMAFVGRMFGGTGRFSDALLLVVWLEFLLTLAQAVQLLSLIILPPLGILIAVASLALFLWLMVNFTAALHGFDNLAKVFFGAVFSFFAIVVILSLLLVVLGVVVPV